MIETAGGNGLPRQGFALPRNDSCKWKPLLLLESSADYYSFITMTVINRQCHFCLTNLHMRMISSAVSSPTRKWPLRKVYIFVWACCLCTALLNAALVWRSVIMPQLCCCSVAQKRSRPHFVKYRTFHILDSPWFCCYNENEHNLLFYLILLEGLIPF